MSYPLDADLIASLRARLQAGRRFMLGLAGAPGAGKSTVAQALLHAFEGRAVVVPMDGFHLANSELARLGLAQRKGAPCTFDATGYVALLERLRRRLDGATVYAPEFRRDIEEAIAGAIAVPDDIELVITEGNYLLLNEAPWHGVREQLDETWYVDVDPDLRRARLNARHMQFGRSEQAARDWVESTDEPNARLIEASRPHAQRVLRLGD
jgi:pantothenate kinase